VIREQHGRLFRHARATRLRTAVLLKS
jgi:hypothetical protein